MDLLPAIGQERAEPFMDTPYLRLNAFDERAGSLYTHCCKCNAEEFLILMSQVRSFPGALGFKPLFMTPLNPHITSNIFLLYKVFIDIKDYLMRLEPLWKERKNARVYCIVSN